MADLPDEPPTDTTDDQAGAEAVDADKLGGNRPGADARRAEESFPPEEPLGVEDPAVLQGGSGTRDDLVTREWRTEPEQ